MPARTPAPNPTSLEAAPQEGSSLLRSLPLLGVVLAIAVGVGAWLIPIGLLEPRAASPRTPRQSPQTETVSWDAPEPGDWMSLLAHIDPIRQPDPPPRNRDPEPTTEQQSETPQPVVPRVDQPDWRYEGFIEEPSRRVALVRVGAAQRFVYEGERVQDVRPRSPEEGFLIERIAPDELVISYGETRFTYPIMQITPTAIPDPGRSPSVLPDPGTPRQRGGESR